MGGITIKGTTITHMRGDTGVLKLDIFIDGQPFDFRSGDTAVLSVKKRLKDSDYILQKTMNEDGQFVFVQADTQDIPFGEYRYDIQVTLKEGQVITAVGPAVYRIVADVTTGGSV